MADLTDQRYWSGRYSAARAWSGDELEWVPLVASHLSRYEGQRFLELGCVPGHASAALLRRVSMKPAGVDFADGEAVYRASLEGFSPEFHRADIRAFRPDRPFDVVGSFGLVEHFDDPGAILDHHDRLLRAGGLCVVEVPNFRRVQWAYQRAFARTDLVRHNLASMNPSIFREFAERAGHEILFLGYVGRLRFWGLGEGAGLLQRWAAFAARVAGAAAGRLLPEGSPSLAPWLVYVARKR